MSEIIPQYEIYFPKGDEVALLTTAAAIVNSYAELGIMLAVTVEQLQSIASQGLLALATTAEQEAVGVAAITFTFPDEIKEFGSWAVHPDWIHTGVGKHLLHQVLNKVSDSPVIALANHNSGPIFAKMGAQVLGEEAVHPDVFSPCQNCGCKGKESLPPGKHCVDTIYSLEPLKAKSKGAT